MLEVAQQSNAVRPKWSAFYFIDDVLETGLTINGVEVVSINHALKAEQEMESHFIIAHGLPSVRQELFTKFKEFGFDRKLVSIVSERASIADSAKIGKGSIIFAGALLSVDVVVEENVVINANSILGHDVRVNKHSVISSMVNIGGNSVVEESCFLGMGSSIKERIVLHAKSTVGMGSVVFKTVPNNSLVLGNPARVIKNSSSAIIYG